MKKNHIFLYTLYTIISIILCMVFVLFFSCSESNLAIFYLLAHEEEIIQSDLEDKLVVKSMIKADDDYFIAAGNIFQRPVYGDSWEQVSNSGLLHENAKCYYIAYFNEKIYGGFNFFESVDIIGSGLYSAKPSSKLKWTKVNDDNLNDKQVMNLMVENNVFFVSVENELNNYSLYYATNDINQFQDTGIPEQSSPIVDIAYNKDATPDYWAISGSHIFTALDALPLDFNEDHTDDVNDKSNYKGIYYSEEYEKIYLSKHNGKVFSYSKTNDEWQDEQIKEGETNVQLYDFSQLIDQKNKKELILVGSKGKGFYIIKNGEIEDEPIARFDDVTVREIYQGTITRFFFDQEEEGNIFFLTDGRGLWWNSFSDGSWKDWYHE